MKEIQGLTRRRYLKMPNGVKKNIDMEEVYRKLDQGMSISQVAKEIGVSRTTLYARHNEYQAYVAAMSAGSDYFAGYDESM